ACRHQGLGWGQEVEEREVGRRRRVDEPIVRAGAAEQASELTNVCANERAVLVAKIVGDDGNALAGLEVLEARRAIEWELQLGGIEHVKGDQLVAAIAEEPERVEHARWLLIEIRDQDDDAATPIVLGQNAEWRFERTLATGNETFDLVERH